MRTYRLYLLALGAGLLYGAGCATPPARPSTIALNAETSVRLPPPHALGYAFRADQRVTAEWDDETRQLPVRVEVSPERIVMAGFSPLGTRLMSLEYDGNALRTRRTQGLDDDAPPPGHVLFSMMISLWPLESWQEPLQAVGWALTEDSVGRRLTNDQGEAVVEVRYEATPPLEGDIIFIMHRPPYRLRIATLHHETFLP